MGKVLYCHDTPNLKLGPGSGPLDPDVIVFENGFADVPEGREEEVLAWARHPGSPHIEVLDSTDQRVPANAPGAAVCVECGKAFATDKALRGHLMSHRKK